MPSDYEQRRDARLAREYASYKAQGGVDLTDAELEQLKADGYSDENGITDAGRLRLHQLRLIKGMIDSGRFNR